MWQTASAILEPAISEHSVKTNNGDDLRPNVRCRLVAKHMVTKYGGEDMEDVFAAMPPFEMVKAGPASGPHEEDPQGDVYRRLKHTYTLQWMPIPQRMFTCRRNAASQELCGKLQYCFMGCGMHPTAGKGSIPGGLVGMRFVAWGAPPCCSWREADDVS